MLRHNKRQPREMGAAEVGSFLTHLSVLGNIAASTENQVKGALLFLYKEVLRTELPWLDGIASAKRPSRSPAVLTTAEVRSVLATLEGTSGLILRLIYGTGMLILEALQLRVKDVDFERREILIREAKGFKGRVTMLPSGGIARACIRYGTPTETWQFAWVGCAVVCSCRCVRPAAS